MWASQSRPAPHGPQGAGQVPCGQACEIISLYGISMKRSFILQCIGAFRQEAGQGWTSCLHHVLEKNSNTQSASSRPDS